MLNHIQNFGHMNTWNIVGETMTLQIKDFTVDSLFNDDSDAKKYLSTITISILSQPCHYTTMLTMDVTRGAKKLLRPASPSELLPRG